MKHRLITVLCGASLLVSASGMQAAAEATAPIAEVAAPVVEAAKSSYLSALKGMSTQWKVAGGVTVLAAVVYYLHSKGVFSNDSDDLKIA